MGNKLRAMSAAPSTKLPSEELEFHETFPEETTNGLCFNEIYLPEEVVMMILSYVDPKKILNVSLVCRKWCNIIKSTRFWCIIYSRTYNRIPKKLPWYVYYVKFATNYFDTNLIRNGNGENRFKYWKIMKNYGDQFKIEDPPAGADPLPLHVPEFHGKTSCFATSFYECNKFQEISFMNNNLMLLILSRYKPHIYVSEWVAARFDCGCVYHLWCKLCEEDPNNQIEGDLARDRALLRNFVYLKEAFYQVEQWAGTSWKKVELLLKDYPAKVNTIVFEHEGKDTQFWKGHYGSKMAGGTLKILFDTIEP